MKNKGLWVLVTLVAVSLGYAVFDVEWSKKQETKKAESSRLVTLSKEAIESFEIEAPLGKFRLEKKEAQWRFVEPIQEAANNEMVREFLDGLVLEKYQQVVAEGENADLKVFGLDQPAGRLKLSAGAQVEEFRVGKLRNFQGEPYLQKNSEPRIYLGEASWNSKFERSSLSFRDRRWMRFPSSDLESLQLRVAGKSFGLIKKDGQWNYQSRKWNLDSAKLLPVVELLNTSLISEVLKEDLKDVAKLKLGTPSLILEAQLGGGKKWVGDFYFQDRSRGSAKPGDELGDSGASLSRVLLVEKNAQKVYVVESEDARKFRDLTEDSLRNRSEAFVFEKSDVKQLSFEFDGKRFKAIEKEGLWKLAEEIPGSVFEGSRMFSVLQSLSDLKVADFENREPRRGEVGKYVLDLQKSDGTSLVSFSFGGLLRKGSKELVVLKSSRFPELITIEKNKWDDLRIPELLKKKESSSSDSSDKSKDTLKDSSVEKSPEVLLESKKTGQP